MGEPPIPLDDTVLGTLLGLEPVSEQFPTVTHPIAKISLEGRPALLIRVPFEHLKELGSILDPEHVARALCSILRENQGYAITHFLKQTLERAARRGGG
jgi:hypothetical protein